MSRMSQFFKSSLNINHLLLNLPDVAKLNPNEAFDLGEKCNKIFEANRSELASLALNDLAYQLFLKASEIEDKAIRSKANYRLWQLLNDGRVSNSSHTMDRNPKQGFEYLKKSAEEGYVKATELLDVINQNFNKNQTSRMSMSYVMP